MNDFELNRTPYVGVQTPNGRIFYRVNQPPFVVCLLCGMVEVGVMQLYSHSYRCQAVKDLGLSNDQYAELSKLEAETRWREDLIQKRDARTAGDM